MDAVSYSHADKQKQRIEKFISTPDSNSGIVTLPSVIETGDIAQIPAGRQIVVESIDIRGELDIQGTLATISGGSISQTTMKTQAIENSSNSASPVDFAVMPTIAGNPLRAGATGGGTDAIFYENSNLVTTSYTITTGKNAMTAGPITVADGVSIVVPDGSSWVIV